MFKFPNGDIYKGHFKKNKFSGFGILKYNDGSLYIGEFKNGFFEGKGD